MAIEFNNDELLSDAQISSVTVREADKVANSVK